MSNFIITKVRQTQELTYYEMTLDGVDCRAYAYSTGEYAVAPVALTKILVKEMKARDATYLDPSVEGENDNPFSNY